MYSEKEIEIIKNVLKQVLDDMRKIMDYHMLGLAYLPEKFQTLKLQDIQNKRCCMDIVEKRIMYLGKEDEELEEDGKDRSI